MTKYICDGCDREYRSKENNLYELKVPKISISNDFERYDLCSICINSIIRHITTRAKDAPMVE